MFLCNDGVYRLSESTADTDIEGVLKIPRRAFLFTNVGSQADNICQTGTPLLLPKAFNTLN